MSDTPRTDALAAYERHRTNAESLYWCNQYKLLCATLERDLARLTAANEALRKFIKRQQIFTGNGGWTTLTDEAIDAAIKEGS